MGVIDANVYGTSRLFRHSLPDTTANCGCWGASAEMVEE
jgi:hypothetical protein